MLRNRAATSRDVAERASVSRATVSYVLNNTPGQKIPQPTRDAVLRAAQELGYRPHPAARLLAGGKGGIIILAPSIRTNDQLARVAKHVTRLLAPHGIAVSVVFDDGDTLSLIDIARGTGATAVVSFGNINAEEAAQLQDAGVALIAPASPTAVNHVIAETQLRYLASLGHETTAFAFSSEQELQSMSSDRFDRAVRMAYTMGLKTPLSGAFAVDGSDAASIISRWTDQGVTAVAAFNDDVALRVLHGARLVGINCPDHLSVIGVDNSPIAPVAYPPLTSVELDSYGIAAISISPLLQDYGSAVEIPSLDSLTSVVERNSARPRQQSAAFLVGQ